MVALITTYVPRPIDGFVTHDLTEVGFQDVPATARGRTRSNNYKGGLTANMQLGRKE